MQKEDVEFLKGKMIYNKLQNIPDRKQTLEKLEEEIYSGDANSKRVEIELKRIKLEIAKQKNDIPTKVFEMLIKLEDIDLDNASADLLELCKRQIVLIELSLSMDITFFNSAYDLFSQKQQEESRVLSK